MNNRLRGPDKAGEQVEMLRQRRGQLEDEMHQLQLRAKYVEAKIAYWEAVEMGDQAATERCAVATYAIADEMKLPRTSKNKD